MVTAISADVCIRHFCDMANRELDGR